MNIDDDRGRGTGLRELFDADREGQRVEARTPIFRGDQNAHQAGFGGRPYRLLREPVVAIHLGCKRENGALRKFANRGAKGRESRREFKIQVKR